MILMDGKRASKPLKISIRKVFRPIQRFQAGGDVTEADLINLGLTSEQAAQQLAILKETEGGGGPQGTTVSQGLTVPAPTVKSNPLIGPSLNLIGSQIPAEVISKLGLDPLISGLSNIGTKVSGGIGNLGTKLGLVSPAAPAAGAVAGAGFGAASGLVPAMPPMAVAGGLPAGTLLAKTAATAAPITALGPFTGLSAALPGLGVGMLVLQAAMAPKITPKQRAEKANWDYQNFLNMRPDVRDLRREGGAGGGGPFVDPKSKFLKQMMKNALFAQNQGAGDLLLPQLQQGIGGMQFSTGLGLGDPREGLFVPRVVRQEGQGPKQFLTGANIRERLDLPAVQGLPPPRVYRDPQGGMG